MPVSTHVKKRLPYPGACQFCGKSIPSLRHRGLHVAHIVSNVPKHARLENLLFFCPSCSEAFDRFLKPRIHKALKLYGYEAPDNWVDDGRRSKQDDL